MLTVMHLWLMVTADLLGTGVGGGHMERIAESAARHPGRGPSPASPYHHQ